MFLLLHHISSYVAVVCYFDSHVVCREGRLGSV